MEFIPNEPLLTSKDIARMCNVTTAIVRYWRKVGKGPAYYKLGCCRYRRDDVEKWLAANRVETKGNDKVISAFGCL